MPAPGTNPPSKLERLIPGLRVLRNYPLAWLPKDLAAGITLGAVMVPVGLAFGSLAGLPMAGFYAAILPLIVYAAFGSSRQLIIGPDASMAALVAVSLGPLAAGDGGKLAVLAAALAIMVGILCIFGSFLRLGFMADFLAKPVIVGFMHGLALVIFAGQLSKILGFKVSGDTAFQELVDAARHLGQTQGINLGIAIFCVATILSLRRWAPRIPGQIVALFGSLIAVRAFHWEAHGIAVLGNIPSGLPKFHVPLPPWEDLRALIPIAFAAALVAFSDTMVTVRAFAARNRYRIDANQEMLALGLGSIAAGLTQGMPISASGSRTAVAESAGSRSQVTSVVAALVIACVMLFFTSALYSMPMAALGGILVASAYNLCEFGEFPRMWRFRGAGFIGSLLTFAGVVSIGVMEGILIGVLFSFFLVLRALTFPHDAVLGRIGKRGFHDRARYPEAQAVPGMIVYRFSGPLFFANLGQFRGRIEGLIASAKEPVKVFVLDASVIFGIDLAACETLAEMHENFREQGIELRIANLRDYVCELLLRGWEEAGSQTGLFFPSLEDSVGSDTR